MRLHPSLYLEVAPFFIPGGCTLPYTRRLHPFIYPEVTSFLIPGGCTLPYTLRLHPSFKRANITVRKKTDDTGLRNYAIITRAVKRANFLRFHKKTTFVKSRRCGTMQLLLEQWKERIFYSFSKRLHLWKYHRHFDFIIFFLSFSFPRKGRISFRGLYLGSTYGRLRRPLPCHGTVALCCWSIPVPLLQPAPPQMWGPEQRCSLSS